MNTSKILSFLLLLAVAITPIQGDAECDCVEMKTLYDTCVSDFWNERREKEACQENVDQFRGDAQRAGELQSALENSQAELQRVRDAAKDEWDTFQKEKEELTAELKDAQALAREIHDNAKAEGKKFKTLQREKTEIDEKLKAQSDNLESAKKELRSLQESLDSIEAAKTIITIDYELLQQRLNEIKEFILAHVQMAKEFLQKEFHYVSEKVKEIWDHLRTKVFPEIVRFVKTKVIPEAKAAWEKTIAFVQKYLKLARAAWEDFYAPHREPVNMKVAEMKGIVSQAYKEHIEPHVIEHKIDQHAAHAKAKAEMYMILAHSELVHAVDSGTGVALKFVESEEGPKFMIDGLAKLHEDPEIVASYIEAFFAAVFVYYFMGWLFGSGKKPKKPKRTKKQWEAEQAAKKHPAKNGHSPQKISKKKKV